MFPYPIVPILKGFGTYLPFYKPGRFRSTTGAESARYCYTVWLRHMIWAHTHGVSIPPKSVAELGPGKSLGTGLAALLSGVDRYYALDVVHYSEDKRNLQVFDELVQLFSCRAPVPNQEEFPRVQPALETYEFPHHILTDELLHHSLHPDRIAAIRRKILNFKEDDDNDIHISYCVPWTNHDVIQGDSIDMIYSQAVLEHVEDLDTTYRMLYHWLKPGDFMSHEIDFKCHETAREWNGHWRYSHLTWKLIQGNRVYLLNREPYSTHIRLLQKYNFEIIHCITTGSPSKLTREDLAPRFKVLSDTDMTTSAAFIQARKR